MGIITGYHLSLAGAAITYLVRPKRREALSRPQVLYSFDDNSLKTYSGYELLTDPSELSGTTFDFVVITLDGNALQADAGKRLVDEMGRAFRGTKTAVILGSVGVDLRTSFLARSGLAETQVTNAVLNLVCYEAQAMTMPVHAGAKQDLLAQADYAYVHPTTAGFTVDLSAPEVAHGFAELYDRSGVPGCSIVPAEQFRLNPAYFAILAAWELLDWPAASSIDPSSKLWQLGTAAMREMQRLSIFGEAGRAASDSASAEGILAFFRQMEAGALPFDFAEFNRYHHGGKVNAQDHAILREALSLGEAEGVDMPALRSLIALLPK